jgi:hypothetical protein
VKAEWGADAKFLSVYRHLPAEAFSRLTFDQICKLRHSSDTMMDNSVEEMFKKDPRYLVIQKIRSSLWRWGSSRGAWNEIVDAYDGLRRFDLGLKGFDIVLDHTTGHNERGYSEHARTFLDGVFGFMVRHNGQHVMMIGFSFAGDGRLLLQQVQSVRQKGNRWLYEFPQRRVEFVIDSLRAAFPEHRVLVVDGAVSRVDRARKSLAAGGDTEWNPVSQPRRGWFRGRRPPTT